ncbi:MULTISPECIES: hypothetical protein [Streptomyces]|nr:MULTISPECIES: hypothetical protein [Streptomyces]
MIAAAAMVDCPLVEAVLQVLGSAPAPAREWVVVLSWGRRH